MAAASRSSRVLWNPVSSQAAGVTFQRGGLGPLSGPLSVARRAGRRWARAVLSGFPFPSQSFSSWHLPSTRGEAGPSPLPSQPATSAHAASLEIRRLGWPSTPRCAWWAWSLSPRLPYCVLPSLQGPRKRKCCSSLKTSSVCVREARQSKQVTTRGPFSFQHLVFSRRMF